MEINTRIIPYSDITKSIPHFENDPYGIASYYSEQRRQVFINNPNLTNLNECAIYLGYVDGIVSGRAMHFPTKLKLDGETDDAISGSALEVAEQYRHLAIGADIMMYPVFKDSRAFVIAAGISEQAIPMYKKLRYTILNYQRCLRINNLKPILKSRRWNDFFSNTVGSILNSCIKVYYKVANPTPKHKFSVRKVQRIPDSINEISLNDGHRYMELHDSKWLQWNLDYNFSENPKNLKGFYIISDNTQDIGFFMIKEAFRKKAGWIEDVIVGSIVEWGSNDIGLLSEADIYSIALNYFSKDVDLIEIASDSNMTIRKMSRLGFLKFRLAHIVFKDKHKKYPDAKDISNWRVRLGYADVIFT